MGTVQAARSEARRRHVRDSLQPINGIDTVELLPAAPGDAGAYLLVYMLKPAGVPAIGPGLVSIRGGDRGPGVAVQWTATAAALLDSAQPWPEAWGTAQADALSAYLAARGHDASARERVLVVRTRARGDLATYTLSLTSPPEVSLDRQLQSIDLSFQGDESEFDRGAATAEARPAPEEPEIDYLAKDYASFRRLMLDRMSTLLPDWTERNPSDLGVTLVEAMSAAADHLSYYQDAVATEAYLGTARRRVSVRRHARLLDYVMHDGCNARTFVALEVGSGEGDPPLRLSPGPGWAVWFLTAVDTLPPAAKLGQIDAAALSRAEVFEPLHDALLRRERNAIPFYTWGDATSALPRGATRATLRNAGGSREDGGVKLSVGDLLLLEEVRSPDTGDEGEARPDRRQIVRLTSVTYTSDPLYDEATEELYAGSGMNPAPLQVVEVGWSDADALAFDLAIGALPSRHGAAPAPISAARGNVVLVDHGRTVIPEEPLTVGDVDLAPPRLQRSPLTQQGRVRDRRGVLVPVDPEAPASHALAWEMRDVQPSVRLTELGAELSGGTAPRREVWYPRRDLLGSDRFASELVVEVDDEERASLRFGDDIKGRRPLPGTRFTAAYRVGNGSRGNISAEALRHVVLVPRAGVDDGGADGHIAADRGVLRVRNPLPGVGGREPQAADEVRLLAPTTFRTQERAVTEADYAAIAERHPEVRKAAAALRWTGSWHTVFVFVERADGALVDDAFRARLGALLERYRMTGHDVRIESPRHVPLDIAFTVHVAVDHLRSAVRKALLEAFSNTVLPDGARGFFHRERWAFGQPVLLGGIIAAAMAVPGVAWVDFHGAAAPGSTPSQRFRRWGEPSRGELEQGMIPIGPTEIARLDNDADRPENGRLELFMQGGV